MKKTGWLTLVLIAVHGFTICPARSAESSSGEQLKRLMFTRLLLDSDPDKSRLGARSISQLAIGEAKQSLSDLAAEHLIKLADPNPDLQPEIADVIGWHVNVLATNVGRYRSVLNEARQRYGNQKILNRIDNTLKSPDAAPVEEYKIRDVDFASIRADADRQWAASRHQDRSQFTKLQTGSRLETVLTALGSPDDITSTTIRAAKYGRNQMLTLHYARAGLILFRIGGTDTRAWGSFEFIDELFDANASYIGQQFGMAQAIAGFRGSLFRDYLIYYERAISKNPDFLPVLEQRLLSVTQPADKLETDAMVRCVQFIYRYGSLEAMDALRRIDKGSTEPHVQKEAHAFATKLQLRLASEAKRVDASGDRSVDKDAA